MAGEFPQINFVDAKADVEGASIPAAVLAELVAAAEETPITATEAKASQTLEQVAAGAWAEQVAMGDAQRAETLEQAANKEHKRRESAVKCWYAEWDPATVEETDLYRLTVFSANHGRRVDVRLDRDNDNSLNKLQAEITLKERKRMRWLHWQLSGPLNNLSLTQGNKPTDAVEPASDDSDPGHEAAIAYQEFCDAMLEEAKESVAHAKRARQHAYEDARKALIAKNRKRKAPQPPQGE